MLLPGECSIQKQNAEGVLLSRKNIQEAVPCTENHLYVIFG